VRHITCLTVLALAAAVGACGEPSGQGFGDSVDKARAAKALSALQTGLVTLAVAQADTAGAPAGNVVPALQAKDPTSRYTTLAPTEPGVVQVVGGGGGPVMLVTLSDVAAEGRPGHYVAVWQAAGRTMYYAGPAAPGYTTEAPSTPGWAATPPR